jgi:hypothetical protein
MRRMVQPRRKIARPLTPNGAHIAESESAVNQKFSSTAGMIASKKGISIVS